MSIEAGGARVSTEEPGEGRGLGEASGDRWQATLDARLERLERLVAGLPAANAERERAVAGPSTP
jgi:hypothetical protein